MKSSNHAEPRDDEAPNPGDEDAESLGGDRFTDEMQDGEGQADDQSGTHTPPGSGGSGDR